MNRRLLLAIILIFPFIQGVAQTQNNYIDLRTTETEDLRKKVKSVSSTGYQMEDGKKGEIIRKEELVFDQELRLASHSEESSRFGKMSIKKTIYQYTSDGKLINQSMSRDGEKITELKVDYDDKGRIVKVEDYRSGELDTQVTYTYDEAGRMDLESFGYGSGELYQQFKYQYDENGYCTSKDVVDPSTGEVMDTQLFKRDAKGNILEMVTMSQGFEVEKTTYRYHPNGETERKIVFDTETGNPSTGSVYDENGLQLESIWYDLDGAVTRSRRMLYDDQGFMISEMSVDSEGEKIGKATKMEYDYDKKGNWITQKVYIDGLLSYMMERTIKY